MRTVVSFLSDFGSQDPYVGEVKAVLLAVSGLTVVDLTHEIPSYSIDWAAFQLLRAYSHFPKDTVHLAIVDPGVGSARKAVYIKVGVQRFVGPDNGLLKWAVEEEARRSKKTPEIFEIPTPKGIEYPTFHGRDLFAPFVVSLLKKKVKGLKKLKSLEGRSFPEGAKTAPGVWQGEILGSDRFGNVLTSVRCGKETELEAELGWSHAVIRAAASYSEIPKGNLGLIRGSHGFWEIAARQTSALDSGNFRIGERVTLRAASSQTKQIT